LAALRGLSVGGIKRNGPLAHFLLTLMVSKESLIELLEPTLHGLGYDLVDIEFRLGSHSLLRLFIDKSGGITLDDCEKVSHEVSGVLDVEDPIPGHYTLEVSSPGLDRILRTADHFRRYAGQKIKLQAHALVNGRKRFKGVLQGVDGEDVILEVDGEPVRVAMDNVHSARLVPDL